MAGSAYIVRRRRPSGVSYAVRYRLGGRAYPIRHAGSFRTQKEAKTRRDLVAGEIAAGRDPKTALDQLAGNTAAPARTLAEWTPVYLESRVDWAEGTKKNMGSYLGRINETLGRRDPATLTPQDIQQLIGRLSTGLKPSSLKLYIRALGQLLDFTGVEPNPVRDRTVKLPSAVREEIEPPTDQHFLAILDTVPARWRLPLVVLEQTGMRVGELQTLTWGNIDTTNRRFRVEGRHAKTRRARWVQVPSWLLDEIEATCPPEDRLPQRRALPRFTYSGAKAAIGRACKHAGIPHYHPHDLRHRRLSLWHGQGIPATELAQRAGHSRPSMTLDVYSHVMPLNQMPPEAFTDALRATLVVSP